LGGVGAYQKILGIHPAAEGDLVSVELFQIPGIHTGGQSLYRMNHINSGFNQIVDIIPDLIEAGVDVIHPIQALAAGMDPRNLKKLYGEKVAFCGGVDTQNLLVNAEAAQVAAKVRELREIFPSGLIISPSHEAILPDVPPKNIRALFDEAGKIY